MEGPRERERESARARDREGQEGRGGTTLRLRSPQPPNHPSQAMVGLFLKRTINSTIIIGIGDELLEARPMRLDERRGKPSEGREKVFYRNDDLPAVTRSSHLAAETFRDPPSPSCRQLSLPPLVSTLIPSQTDTNAPLPPTPPASTCTRGRARWKPWDGDARGGTGSSHDVSVGRRGWSGSRCLGLDCEASGSRESSVESSVAGGPQADSTGAACQKCFVSLLCS